MLYVYHNTSKDNAENIRKTGVMSAKEDGIFVSTKPDGQSEFDISSDIRYIEGEILLKGLKDLQKITAIKLLDIMQ